MFDRVILITYTLYFHSLKPTPELISDERDEEMNKIKYSDSIEINRLIIWDWKSKIYGAVIKAKGDYLDVGKI